MKKQMRNMIVALCVVLALAAGVLIVKFAAPKASGGGSSSSSAASITLLKEPAANVTQLQVKNSAGGFVIHQPASGKYTVDGLNGIPLYTSAISTALKDASTVSAAKLVEKASSNLSQYGLSNPAATFTATISGHTYSFNIGSKASGGDGYYLCKAGNNDVYKANTDITTYFLGSNLSFVDKTLVAVPTGQTVSDILLEGTARPQPIELKAQNSASSGTSSSATYTMVSPRTYNLDTDKVNSITGALSSLSASDVVSLSPSTADKDRYGLSKPPYTMKITYGQTSVTIDFGNKFNANSTDYLPVMIEGRNIIYKIEASTVSFYNDQLSDICSRNLFNENLDSVKSLTVTSGNSSYTFEVTGTGNSLKASYQSKSLKTDNMQNFYQTLESVGSEGAATRPSGGQVYAHVEVTFKDQTKAPVKMDFLSMNDRDCYWSMNGQGDFYVLRSDVDKVVKNAADLAAGKTVSVS